jgi:hypothetical protein
LVEGRGSEEELSLASRDFISIAEARSVVGLASRFALDLGLVWEWFAFDLDAPSSGALVVLLGSLVRRDRELVGVTV